MKTVRAEGAAIDGSAQLHAGDPQLAQPTARGRDAHPMAICSSVVGALSTFYQDSLNPHDARQVEISVHRLLAKLPTIAAYAYKKSSGQPFMYPQNDLNYCENLLRMMFAVPSEP